MAGERRLGVALNPPRPALATTPVDPVTALITALGAGRKRELSGLERVGLGLGEIGAGLSGVGSTLRGIGSLTGP